MNRRVATKRKVLITILAGLLGNLLGFLSISLMSQAPQLAFDLSHLSTFTVALFFGPYCGLLAGGIVGIYSYFYFGVLGAYGPFWGLAIIIGKALTGYTCGLIRSRVRPYLTVAVSYIPEFIFSVVFYTIVGTRLAPDTMTPQLVSDILFKGWVEILILSFILDTIFRREILEAAIVLLEIFIVALLVHKEHTHTLALLLGIVFVIMLTVDVVRERIRVEEPEGKDP